MSQPLYPRKIKFVGGPSKKRRRCTCASSAKPTSSRPAPAERPATAADSFQRSIQPISTGLGETDRNYASQVDNSHVQPNSAHRNDNASHTTVQAATSFANEPQALLEPLLDWRAEDSLPINTDALESCFDFKDPFSLFAPTYPLPSSPTLGFANGLDAGPSLNTFAGYPPQDGDPSPVESIPSEGSSSSTEDIERDIDPGQEIHASIPGYIGDNVDGLFAQYDREFCVWPLTHDFEANPFRYDIETGRGSPLLWHSILALSYKHIHRETGACLAEARVHKKKAMKLLEELEGDIGSDKSRTNLLNGLLILMTLDCATSAQGPWVVHLSRAQRFIEALEVLKIQKTPKIQAQIDMFVWWDVTLGLTTRQGFVLSGHTVSSVFRSKSASTFYNISGCPEELFKYMFQLGTYAREFELASRMTCVTFDMGPVLAVEKAIKEWREPQFDDPDTDFTQPGAAGLPCDWGLDSAEAAHYVQDLYHCAQAWRFALLIYIERVFKWRRREASASRLSFFARKTLNNVSSCRRSVMVQKQLLLPVFLAGCETDDENLREEARDYCRWWGVKTRYDMFITTLGLLEEVWAATGYPDSWWGSLIDQKSGVGSTRQYLFG